MFGFTIICLAITTILLLGWIVISMANDWDIGGAISIIFSIVCTVIIILCVLNIPGKQIDSRKEIEQLKQFQITLNESRQDSTLSEFERIQIIKDVNAWNYKIAEWKTKGNKWYQNDWLYDDKTKEVDYIK